MKVLACRTGAAAPDQHDQKWRKTCLRNKTATFKQLKLLLCTCEVWYSGIHGRKQPSSGSETGTKMSRRWDSLNLEFMWCLFKVMKPNKLNLLLNNVGMSWNLLWGQLKNPNQPIKLDQSSGIIGPFAFKMSSTSPLRVEVLQCVVVVRTSVLLLDVDVVSSQEERSDVGWEKLLVLVNHTGEFFIFISVFADLVAGRSWFSYRG